MNIDIYDNAEELYTGKNVSFPSEMPRFYIVRVTVKDGVTKINNPFGNSCVMMNDGISDDFIYPTINSATELYNVGEEVIYYINAKNNASTGFLQVFSSFSNFLSKVKILHDPLPIFIKTNGVIKIESEDFEAPNGLLLSPSAPIFSGSTFKTAPKIWADGVLDGIYHFPPSQSTVPISDSGIYRPFANCPNMTKISKQGKISESIKTLGMIDLTYEDSDGYVRLDAYPECVGTPEVVVSYVPPMPDKIVKLSSIPNTLINAKNLKKLHLPFHFREYLIDDTISSLQLPLAGLDFKDLEMESCTLDNFNFSLDSSLISDEDKDFTLTLPMFGIVAPKSAKLCENLHTLHMSISEKEPWNPEDESMNTQSAWLQWAQENKNHLLTPQWISDHISYGWGENLKKYYDDNGLWDYVDENCLPLLPTGVKRLTGYMAKNYVLNGFVYYQKNSGNSSYNFDLLPKVGYDKSLGEFVSFSEEQRWLHKDGVPFTFITKPITLSSDNANNNNQITGAYKNLYANLYIDEQVNVPSIPQNCNYTIGWCQGLFANAQGFGGSIFQRESEEKAKVLISWAKSNYHNRALTPSQTVFGINTVEVLEDDNEVFEAVDNKNSNFMYMVLEKENNQFQWENEELKPANVASTRATQGAYLSYDDDAWTTTETWLEKYIRVNSVQEIKDVLEEYKNKMDISVRVNYFNYEVIFDDSIPSFLSSETQSYKQVFFGAAVNWSIQDSLPKISDVDYMYQNLAEAYVSNNFFFSVVEPYIFSLYVERDDLEYPVPPSGVNQRLTTCYSAQIMMYFNNFTTQEISEDDFIFPGLEILESLSPSRQAQYIRNYQSLLSRDLFLGDYVTQAQQILTDKNVATPINTVITKTDTVYKGERVKNAYSKELQYSAAYDLNYVDKNEHMVKNPNIATSLASPVLKCHMMYIWNKTFGYAPTSAFFSNKNTIANVDNFTTRVTMRPTNSTGK